MSEERNENELILRAEFGLPPITSEEGAPEVETPLIERFLSDEEMTSEEAEKVLDHASRFASWREEYIRVVVRDYRLTKEPEIKPDFPKPS